MSPKDLHNKRRPGQDRVQQSSLTKFFKFRFIAVAITIAVVACLVAYSFVVFDAHEAEHNGILNVLGRQRMLTQMVAKDVNRISSLLDALETEDRLQDTDTLRAKLVDTRFDLRSAAKSFDSVLAHVSAGYLPLDVVKAASPVGAETGKPLELFDLDDPRFASTIGELRSLWLSFLPRLETVAASEVKDASFRSAIIFINENEGTLLELSDRLNGMALARFSARGTRNETLYTVTVFALIILAIWFLYGTYVFLMEPYSVFYQGIRNLGVFENHDGDRRKRRYSALTREVTQSFAALRDMVGLVGVISQGSSFQETLSIIFKTFRSYVPYDYIGVATFAGNRGTRLIAAYGESGGALPSLPKRLGERDWDLEGSSLGPILESGAPRVINDLESYSSGKEPREYTKILLESGIRASITLPLSLNGAPLGFIFFSSLTKDCYSDLHLSFLRNIRNAIALAFEKDIFVDELVYASTLALAKMAEARDEDTADHLDRMSRYTVLLARLMQSEGVRAEPITAEYIRELGRFSPMHDIGKVGIRDDVLLKPGKLDEAEWEHMKTHATYGANVLREAENSLSRKGRAFFGMGIEIAAAHHERWDGSGYPAGLSGERIPLSARIVAVADVLDALTTRRPYKAPFGFEESFALMKEGAGSHFDPAIFACFERNQDAFRALYREFLAETPGTF